MAEVAERCSDLVSVIADMGADLVATLLRDHARQDDARCALCPAGPQAGHMPHPCNIYSVALAAQALIIQRRRASAEGKIIQLPNRRS